MVRTTAEEQDRAEARRDVDLDKTELYRLLNYGGHPYIESTTVLSDVG